MSVIPKATFAAALFFGILLFSEHSQAQRPEIPDVLQPWQDWATWNDKQRDCPPAFNNVDDRICFWPSRLTLNASTTSGSWEVIVIVFAETWMALPGSADNWPLDVMGNGEPVVVVERNGKPAVKLSKGRHELSGNFSWDRMPQRISIPKEIGILSLTVEEKSVSLPNWDADGNVWLKRLRTEETEKDQIAAQVYRLIEDGIPVWLRTDVELTVSGKSREEELGWVLPEGWLLATVESPLPVAVDDQGRMKAQVRAGKWTISLHAFRSRNAAEIQFSSDAQPVVDRELVAFRAQPEFRLVDLTGVKQMDVTQTTFPTKWRSFEASLPVYQWDTSTAIGIIEKSRGLGVRQPEGLTNVRQFWLDQDGKGLTYSDTVTGNMQQIWRLDTAAGQQLGAVRIDGKGQLITSNAETGDHGVEIRTRNLKLDAIGRIDSVTSIPAIGWQTDVDHLSATFNLPPGWRMLALFGADSVQGDWLTAWSLLDLFLLLVFGLAVCRMWGIPAGMIAFLAFGLAYHEPGSPRLTWLFLLMPVGLLRVVPEGTAQKWIKFWKYIALVLLVINLAPFLASQIQNALYPQLERPGINFQSRTMFDTLNFAYQKSAAVAEWAYETDDLAQTESLGKRPQRSKFQTSNLRFDPKAQIQTGPAQPEWKWNRVDCYWDESVSAKQSIRPFLVSRTINRIITVLRIPLLVLLAAIVLGGVRLPRLLFRRSTAAAVLLATICLAPGQLPAQQIPSEKLLQDLRERLLEPGDAFPRAGEIPAVNLKLEENRVTMTAEIHTALDVAVPLPGRIPTWSPISVTVDGKPSELVCRKDGFLWTVLSPGVHQVVVQSMLADVSEWQWTFLLKPRTVTIDAPGWNVTGVRPNGVPDDQLFFARERKNDDQDATYGRKDFNVLVAVDRHLETGLVWQVRNEVTRLSAPGQAVSIKVPLLAGEKVLTSNMVVEDQSIEVKLGAGQQKFAWVSEIPVGTDIQLTAAVTDKWVERWHLVTSPVWNMSSTGLAPVYEVQPEHLVPIWHPWPGEQVDLAFTRPTAVTGETLTVQRVKHETELSTRLRKIALDVELESSLGGEFNIELESNADVSSVKVGGQAIPVRLDESTLIIPVQPGKQQVTVNWETDQSMQTVANIGKVTLPVECANISSVVRVPAGSRWVLWTRGPTLGPAVRFWVILIFAVLAAFVLGGLKWSPLKRLEWALLAVGLTQVHISAALFVVGWLFLLAWRGRSDPEASRRWLFNLRQIGLVLITFVAIGILIVTVGAGLLGNPEMFIIGNGSSRSYLNWFQPRAASSLPEPMVVSTSIWFYRLLMLFWALWLASALLRWLTNGWKQFSHGGAWRHKPILAEVTSAPVPAEGET